MHLSLQFASTLLIASFVSCGGIDRVGTVAERRAVDDPIWAAPLNSGDWAACYGVSADGTGNVYATGFTVGTLDGQKAKAKDAFLVKYDASGNRSLEKLIGTDAMEVGNGIASSDDHGVWITGLTSGKLADRLVGGFDAFVARFDSGGKSLWLTQFGTNDYDEASKVAVDKTGNAFISGWTKGSLDGKNFGGEDIFLARFDSDGKQIWVRQYGTSGDDRGNVIAVDGIGNVCVAGSTTGSFEGKHAGNGDVFVAKFDAAGNQVWIRQLGTTDIDYCYGVVLDAQGNVFISGHTGGQLGKQSKGGFDVFVAKFDSNGTHEWVKQYGTKEDDSNFGLSIDSDGRLFLTGGTTGSLARENLGNRDAFLMVLDALGQSIKVYQFGTSEYDNAMDISVDQQRNVFIGGETNGQFDGSQAVEDSDAFTASLRLE